MHKDKRRVVITKDDLPKLRIPISDRAPKIETSKKIYNRKQKHK